MVDLVREAVRTSKAGASDSARAGEGDLLGIGLYTAAETERLLRIPAPRIRRWLRGYSFNRDGVEHRAAPLWEAQVPDVYETLTLSFRDIVEVRIVDRFVRAGISLRTVRLALDRARQAMGTKYPFVTQRFRTDGRTIFLEIVDRAEEPLVYDLLRKQFVFRRIIAPSFKDLDFVGEAPVRWWPLQSRRTVVLDPARAFGQPIVAQSGVPTATLAAAVQAEGSVDAVARWYESDIRAVRDAVEFERRLAA